MVPAARSETRAGAPCQGRAFREDDKYDPSDDIDRTGSNGCK